MFTKKGAIWRLFLCPVIFLNLAYSSAASAGTDCSSDSYDQTAAIRYIHDGDTLHLKNGDKIRLIGINTPELARDNKAAEPFAEQAKESLKTLFKADKSTALVYGKDKKDHYGRYLAHAFLNDGQNVQAILLKKGLASVITVPPNTRFARCYLEMEHVARCNKTGLWENTPIVQAKKLTNKHIGFHLIQGRVSAVDINDKGIWLNLDDQLTVGIRSDNLPMFDISSIKNMLNQSIIVRGWTNKSKYENPFYLRVRHPLSIQLTSAFSCN